MNPTIEKYQRVLKTTLAALLFILLLVGGSAAAFSALAAGISTLSGVTHGMVAAGAPAPTIVSAPSPATTTAAVKPSRSTSSIDLPPIVYNTAATEASPATIARQLNAQIDQMHSPIGEAIDNGGVVVGEGIESTFGHFLSGILQTLFLEQSNAQPATTLPPSTTSPALGGH